MDVPITAAIHPKAKLTRSSLERHWRRSADLFRSEYRPWAAIFWDLVPEVTRVLDLLQGRRKLPENCSYLLLSKSLNHAFAMFSLAESGLCVDAASAARNAVESLLLLQVLVIDSSEDLFRRWANGEEFKPGWVRNELKAKSPSAVRDVIVQIDQAEHDLNRSVYRWLSNITHANLDSANHTVRHTSGQSYEVFVGGSLLGKKKLLNAVFAALCARLHQSAVICMAVFDPVGLKKSGDQWSALDKRINEAAGSFAKTASE